MRKVSKRDGWVMVHHPELGLLVEAVCEAGPLESGVRFSLPGEKEVEPKPLLNPLQPLVLQPSSKEVGLGSLRSRSGRLPAYGAT